MNSSVLRLVTQEQLASNFDFAVSSINGQTISNFSDDLWNLSPYIENLNCKRSDKEIDFNIRLPDGRFLTDKAHEKLLLSVKGFLYARMTRPYSRSGKVSKPRTVVGVWFRLRPLINWMIQTELDNFDRIAQEHVKAYQSHVSSLSLNANTVLKRLSILEMLYVYADYYPSSLKQHPWPGESSVALSGDIKRSSFSTENQTQAMPPIVFETLGKTALRVLEENGKSIIAAHLECCKVLRDYRSRAIERLDSGSTKPVGIEKEFQIQYCATRANLRSLSHIVEAHGFKTYGDLNTSVRTLHTAAYIVCAMFSGIRDSEMASLEIGAFRVGQGMDGDTYYWLYGTTYKLEETPRQTRWMVPECVGRAVSILEEITAFHRESLQHHIEHLKTLPDNVQNRSQINELERWSRCLFLTKGFRDYTYRNIDNETANHRLRMFFEEFSIVDEEGKIWPIATHQFRRTFAVFVAKNLIGDLRYLRHHFKHWSMDMTLHYARYERGDDTLVSEIINERDRLYRIIVSDWFSSDSPLSGAGGKAVVNFRSRHKVKTAKNLQDAVANLADGLFIRSTGHSWCMSNAESCGGQGLYDSLQCASCDNAIIDQSLLPTWKGIRAHQATILELDDIGEPVKHYAKQQIEAADRIIQELANGNN